MTKMNKLQKIKTWASNYRIRNQAHAMRELGYIPVLSSDQRAFNLLLSRAKRGHGVEYTRIGRTIIFGV